MSTGTQTGFRITGNLKHMPARQIIYLLKGEAPENDKSKWTIIDSVKAVNGRFQFSGTIPQTDFYCIAASDSQWCSFVLENSHALHITGDYNDMEMAAVSGSENTSYYKKNINRLRPLIERMNAYADSAGMASEKNDTARYNHYAALNQAMVKEIVRINFDIVKSNRQTFFSLVKMTHYYKDFTKDEISAYYNNLPADLKNTSQAKILYYQVFKSNNNTTPAGFYDFPLIDTSCSEITYKPFYGNYVLLDFWASWCIPCIKNLPYIKNINNKFGNKNFKVISVSLDDRIDPWKKQVIKDATGWLQAADLKGWQGLPVKFFKIKSIPRYVLLDPAGKVIAEDIPLNEIESKLSSLLGQ
jgi:thiol-disulfide isomerase/thioredoxin